MDTNELRLANQSEVEVAYKTNVKCFSK